MRKLMINSRRKGAAGEREFSKWLQEHLELDFLPQRNLEQVRSGGADIIDVEPFFFEVKRTQTTAKRAWWLQVVLAVKNYSSNTFNASSKVPVVAFRQNNRQWKFLISATEIRLGTGFIQLEEREAKEWLRDAYKRHKLIEGRL